MASNPHADHALTDASVLRVIATGVLLGVVHVVTGPDHLSALAVMASNSSWKAFSLGVRWGCGHSLGLVLMALVFFAAGQSFDLSSVDAYCNYVVGVFMVALGVWMILDVRRKARAASKTKQRVSSPSMAAPIETAAGDAAGAERVELGYIACDSPVADAAESIAMEQGESLAMSSPSVEPAAPTSAIHIEIIASSLPAPPSTSSTTADKPLHHHHKCAKMCSLSNPVTQRFTALGVGIIHGIAGPGGILGVLPAVVMNDYVKSTAYLASFCIASIFIMGVVAAIYGEVTGRMSRHSALIEVRIALFSAAFSLVVGVAWISLQATGQFAKIFG